MKTTYGAFVLATTAGLGASSMAFDAGTTSDMTFVAPTNLVMPLLAVSKDGVVTQGILRDIGQAIAAHMKMRAIFVALPSRRVAWALTRGIADGVCYVRPDWISGDFNWSESVISNQGLVVSKHANGSVRSIPDLANRPMGTVLGYQYPDIEMVLNDAFVRDDAPSMAQNLQKLASNRFEFAVTEKNTMDYNNQGQLYPSLVPIVTLSKFSTQCAFSKKSKIPFGAIDMAIKELVHNGTVEKLLQKYH